MRFYVVIQLPENIFWLISAACSGASTICANLRFCYQAPLYNHAYLYIRTIFIRQDMLYKTNIYDGITIPWKSFFDLNCIDYDLFFQNFCDLWGFLRIRCLVAKSESLVQNFSDFLTHYGPTFIYLEMGNLEAKYCVQ